MSSTSRPCEARWRNVGAYSYEIWYVPHAKMKARRTLVELSFARFDAEFARDVAAVSDGDGVSDEARATPEVKVEASRRSAHLFETP